MSNQASVTETQTETQASKTGPKPKELVEGVYLGYEVGRGPKKQVIDPNEVIKLASLGMKNTEMAEWFGIDDSTLRYNFKQEIAKGKLELIQSLRMAQIQTALGGNVVMQIWLGRNILGQSENGSVNEKEKVLPFNSVPDDMFGRTPEVNDLCV